MEQSDLTKTGGAVSDARDYAWDQISASVAASFRFTPEETQRLVSNSIARLIGALPFLAGAKDPYRTAVAHLSVFIASCRLKHLANPRPSDDEYLMRRIELLSNFIGGDPEIIRRGMNLIALWMLNDYQRDIDEDSLTGKYNPLSAGVWDYETEKARLIREIEAVPCPEMDGGDSRFLWSFWEL